MQHRYLPPSPCVSIKADGTTTVDTRTVKVWAHKDERIRETEQGGAAVDTPKMFYVTTKRMADAMKGSRNAKRQLTKATIWAVFATMEAADAYIATRKLHMVAGIVEQ